jgi:fructoselysine 6-kinase
MKKKTKIIAMPCLCVDIFDGTDEIRPGGEALNFAAHASEFDHIDIALISVIGNDTYGKTILDKIADKKINTENVRVDATLSTASNRTYLTPEGDRYYLEDSWKGDILEQFTLNDDDIKLISEADLVFTHFLASCFTHLIELKKQYDFKLAVDFDVYRDFDDMKQYAPYIDFFMISGEESLLHHFEGFSREFDGLFNMSLGEKGSVTYYHGIAYQVQAKAVDDIIDTTGCGDSYHAGFVCSFLRDGDIVKAMNVGSEIAAETLKKYGGF